MTGQVISLKPRVAAPKLAPEGILAEAIKELSEKYPDVVKGVVIFYDPKEKCYVLYCSETAEALAYISLQLGKVALEVE